MKKMSAFNTLAFSLVPGITRRGKRLSAALGKLGCCSGDRQAIQVDIKTEGIPTGVPSLYIHTCLGQVLHMDVL